MLEIDSMKALEEALKPLDGPAKKRVLDWACAFYLGTHATTSSVTHVTATTSHGLGNKSVAKKKGKGKTLHKQIKDLNLSPGGKQSGKDFSLEKQPSNAKQKCVVAVYYLRDVLGVSAITIDHVYTYFKNAGWPAPTDLANTLQQAGSAGWLDTADAQNILITPIGGNLIDHQLPKPAKQ